MYPDHAGVADLNMIARSEAVEITMPGYVVM
jgi:hypothetical protein